MGKKAKYLIVGLMVISMAAPILIVMMSTKAFSPELYLVLGLVFVLDVVVMSAIFALQQKEVKFNSAAMPDHIDLPYQDRLMRIDEQGITVKFYYSWLGSKRVHFSDIEIVKGYNGGSFRIWGTGDFRTWFGLDWGRPSRDMTFVIIPKKGRRRIGFTTEDSATVAAILRERNLLDIQDKNRMG